MEQIMAKKKKNNLGVMQVGAQDANLCKHLIKQLQFN